MATSYDVHYPSDMMEASQGQLTNWAESTIHSVVDSLEEYARAKPLSFALGHLGSGLRSGGSSSRGENERRDLISTFSPRSTKRAA